VVAPARAVGVRGGGDVEDGAVDGEVDGEVAVVMDGSAVVEGELGRGEEEGTALVVRELVGLWVWAMGNWGFERVIGRREKRGGRKGLFGLRGGLVFIQCRLSDGPDV
jgi:hypothetical protein